MGEKHLNSVKAVLIYCVVVAHAANLNSDQNSYEFYLLAPFTLFMMPLFIMIAGYQSKKTTWKKWKKTAITLLSIYLLYQLSYNWLAIFKILFDIEGIPDAIAGDANIITFLFVPAGPLWFIVGLILWKYIAYIISKYKIPASWSISFFVVIGLSFGFINAEIQASRVLVFTPYFLLGYYCQTGTMEKMREIPKIYAILILLAVPVILYFYNNPGEYVKLVFAECPYAYFSNPSFAFISRLFLYPLSVVVSLAVFILIPDRFHSMGNRTLQVLLWHPLLLYPLYYGFIKAYNIDLPFVMNFVIGTIIFAICVYIAKFRVTLYAVNPMLLIERLKPRKEYVVK